jgi:uncharacterized membrane protein
MTRVPEKVSIAAIYVFFIIGAVWNSLGVFQDLMRMTTPFVLIGATLYCVYLTYEVERRMLLAFGGILLVLWAIEALGVATGFPFGTYAYSSQLGWMILGVPIVVPFVWILVISSSDAVGGHFFGRVSTSLVAVLATLLNFFMEFAAGALDLWHWSTRFPPASNYAGWFVLTFAAALLLRDTTKRKIELRLPAHIYIGLLLYFCITFVGIKSGLITL